MPDAAPMLKSGAEISPCLANTIVKTLNMKMTLDPKKEKDNYLLIGAGIFLAVVALFAAFIYVCFGSPSCWAFETFLSDANGDTPTDQETRKDFNQLILIDHKTTLVAQSVGQSTTMQD